MELRKVTVVGGGQMGNGIAHVFAVSGLQVGLVDVDKALLDKALAAIGRNMDRQVAKKLLTAAAKEEALARIKTTQKI